MEGDDFAQTRGSDDLFESEISPQPPAPLTAPREPRGARRGSGGHYQPNRTGRPKTENSNPPAADGVPTGPKQNVAPANVDRSLSGGVKKPKLTEEELAERMSRIKLKNQQLEERRRKAEEDEAGFLAAEAARREKDDAARKKHAEQEKNRRELDEEREKNRQRKLNAVQNREWDSEKKEEDYNPKKYNPRYRRGAHGAVAPPSNAPKGPKATNAPPPPQSAQNAGEGASDWPELPADRGKSSSGPGDGPSKVTIPEMSPAIGGGTWADQVEAGSPATPR